MKFSGRTTGKRKGESLFVKFGQDDDLPRLFRRRLVRAGHSPVVRDWNFIIR